MSESDDVRVTRRYRPPVTRRYDGGEAGSKEDPGRVTRRYEEQQGRPAPSARRPGALAPGTLVADHYSVAAGPLGQITGEAEVYRCVDRRDDGEVALKLYHYDAEPKEAVIEQLIGLVHPHIVRLIGYGSWGGRFYEVMEYCAGGTLADIMPFTESRLVGRLPAVMSGLDFCHRQGIVHRDLKPNNLFFRDADRNELLIGDFGISSYLDLDEDNVRVTQSSSHLTLDYAAPELLDGHEVSIKTDYYALGITLIHLLTGRSPFHGLSHNDVLVAHLRGRIRIPPIASERLTLLLRGLTLGNPDARWGFEALSAWLQGDEVSIDERDVAWSSPSSDEHPYPGYPQAKTPEELAESLGAFDAAKELFRGDIRRWVFDHFDSTMGDRIEMLEEEYTNHPDVALELLRFVLAPGSSLSIGVHRVTSIAQLNELLDDETCREPIQTALSKSILDAWVESGKLAGDRTGELVSQIRDLRKRVRGTSFDSIVVRSLSYILDPTRPLRLSTEHAVSSPAEIGQAFHESGGHLVGELARVIFSKELEEWIRAARFDGWEEDLRFLRRVRHFYLDNRKVGAYCVGWHFKPDIPFPFRKDLVSEPARLAELIEASAKNRKHALELLDKGWIRAWLVGSGRIADPTALDHALLELDATLEAKLEAVLQMLNPTLVDPQIDVKPKAINFGRLHTKQTRTRKIVVNNTGRGHLHGSVRLAEYGEGVFLDNYEVEGNHRILRVTINPSALSPGTYRNTLFVETNGGNAEVIIVFGVVDPPDTRSWFQKLIGGV